MSGLSVLIKLMSFLAQGQVPYISGSQIEGLFDRPNGGGEGSYCHLVFRGQGRC